MIFADTSSLVPLAPLGAADDPLVWTPSAVDAELKRVLTVFDIVNNDVSAAEKAGKVSGSEWNSWRAVYLAGHDFLTSASSLWGSNVKVARQHEQEAGKWRDLVASRGQQVQGPADLIRKPESSGVSYWTLALIGVGAVATLVAYHKIKRYIGASK